MHTPSEIHQVAYVPEVLPSAVPDENRCLEVNQENPAPPDATAGVSKGPVVGGIVPGKPVPIDLDAVFRLTEDRNPKIALARAKVHEAILQRQQVDVACMLHKQRVGKQVEADARIWQRKAELSKTLAETLQDAATTYLDFLTAQRVIAVTEEMAGKTEPLLKRAEDLQKNDPSTKVLYESVRVQVVGRTQAIVKLKQQQQQAAAKLLDLLGLPCDAILAPLDLAPVPINLVPGTIPTCKLVEQAVATGPAIQETRGLLEALVAGHARVEALFCFCTKKADVQTALDRNRETQVNLTIQDLASKLTAGVQEARAAIILGLRQIAEGIQQVQHARESYRLGELRIKENVERAPGASIPDVMQSIRGLETAELGVLTALNAYNQAQVRLLIYLGPGHGKPPPPH